MIRFMNEEDIAEVCKIENSIFLSPWSYKSFTSALKRHENIYMVSCDNEKITGYIGIWTSFETADLCNIAVRTEYRHQYIGKKLLHKGIERCKDLNVEKILLEVRESNVNAIRLYRKTGFEEIGYRKKYYSKPEEDAVIMQKTLNI